MNNCNHIFGVTSPGYDSGTVISKEYMEVNENFNPHDPYYETVFFIFCPKCGVKFNIDNNPIKINQTK